MSLEAFERETTINLSDGDDVVRIWTAQRKVITALRKKPAFIEIRSGNYEGSVWAEFEVDADKWSPATGLKRTSNKTPEQVEEFKARMERSRETSND